MATASFSKEFVVHDKAIAKRILSRIESGETTIKVPAGNVNLCQSMARSEEQLKKLLSR